MAYTKQQLANLVIEFAGNYGIDPAIALEQIKRESANFRSDVVYGPFVAGAGERGMAQFTPGAWTDWGQGPHTAAYVPETSLHAWGKYMRWLLNRYGGDYSKALMAYNGGPGNVDKGRVSSAAQRYAREVIAAAGRTGASGGSNLPESSYPNIVFCGGEDLPPCPSDDPGAAPPPRTDSNIPLLLLGGAVLLAVVLLSD